MRTIVLLIFISTCFNLKANDTFVLTNLASSFANVRDFTKFKNEAYFSAQNTLGNTSVIIRVELVNDEWTNPQIASFSGKYHDIEAFLAPNGLALYFASNRPINEKDKSKDYDIWYVTRENSSDNWSEPLNMGSVINTDKNEFYPSVANNGNLYFTSNYQDTKGKDDIYFSQYKNGQYHKPYSLSENINTNGDEYNAYIAPNEMYLIFGAYKRKDSLGSGDLYMSTKDKDGKWFKAENLGNNVNSKFMDYCPFVDVPNNTLYFTSKKINQSNKEFTNLNEILKEFNNYENGMSRIYKTTL